MREENLEEKQKADLSNDQKSPHLLKARPFHKCCGALLFAQWDQSLVETRGWFPRPILAPCSVGAPVSTPGCNWQVLVRPSRLPYLPAVCTSNARQSRTSTCDDGPQLRVAHTALEHPFIKTFRVGPTTIKKHKTLLAACVQGGWRQVVQNMDEIDLK